MIARRGLLGYAFALAAQSQSQAQAPAQTRRIGFLGYTAVNTADDDRVIAAFKQRLREHGLVEGGNLTIEWRYGEGQIERYDAMAAELVALGVELVVVGSGTAARAVMKASRSLPVVTIAVPDPVRSGLAASLAHPGGQVTGMSNLADELVPKRIELLKAAVPAANRIAIARCPRCAATSGESSAEITTRHERESAAARSVGVTLVSIDVNAASDFPAAADAIQREHVQALLLAASPINVALREQWAALAANQRLPMLAPSRGFGAMLSFGPDFNAVFRRAADFVARILNGTRPADLPMEQPTQFEFVVNQRLARAIGVTIPQAALLRADEVID